MPHRIETLSSPVIFAHRGASAFAPENTLSAFRLALEHGADGIELDTKLSADGHVVVIHDQTVNRTTGKPGVVRQMTLTALKALDAGSHFDPAFAGEPIPTLAEVFAAVGTRTLINVEIANYASAGDASPEKIAALVREYGLQDQVMFSSFHPWNLLRIRRQLPQAPVAILTLKGVAGQLLRGRIGRLFSPDFLHPYHTDVTEFVLEREHRAGRRVNAWTVNHPEDMRRLFRMGIDGIITDDPRLARRIMEEK
jgi:glycerophosphoryl diester phosphodiesterase